MKLLILNGARDSRPGLNPGYRGTYRAHPSHCDELPDEHEINRLFFWFLEEGGELGVVQDLPKAQRFAELWNARLNESQRFEVIEATDLGTTPSPRGSFIGFDLSAGYNNSLLAEGLKQSVGATHLPEPIREFWDLICQHYAPQLNRQGLFQTLETANLCLRSMTALQRLSPNFFEGGDLSDFHPVRLHAVSVGGAPVGPQAV
ncbi:MAG: hypothetical protein WAN12_05615 [Candidatus Acidiferrum sp.]